ncbi:MAG: translocation/assembly module TamB domain-containing protein [Nitrospirota bacterium]
MRRVFRWVSILLLLFLIAAAGITAFFVSTERGLQWLLPRVIPYIPGELSFRSVRGRLIGPLVFRGVRYHTDTTVITTNSLVFDWAPLFLFSGEFYISELKARGLVIKTLDGKESQKEGVELPQINVPPFPITVKDASFNDIMVQSGDTTPRIIDRIAFEMSTGLNVVLFRRLAVDAPEFRLAAKGKVRPSGDYAFSAGTQWSVSPKGYPTIKGSGSIKGSLKELALEQRLSAPTDAHIEATIAAPFTALQWKARLKVTRFNPQTINRQWPALLLSGDLQGAGDQSFFAVSGTYTAAHGSYGTASGRLMLSYNGRIWNLQHLSAALHDSTARAELSGTYTQLVSDRERGSLTLKGAWSNLTWPLQTKAPILTSSDGSFSVSGVPDDYSFSLSGHLAGKSIPEGRWSARGRGDTSSVKSAALQGSLLGGEVRAEGRVSWKPGIVWHMSMSCKGLDPGRLWPAWPGKLSVRGRISGDIHQTRQILVDLSEANGKLRGYPLSASLRLLMNNGNYRLARSRIVSGRAVIAASGTLSDRWDFRWSAAAPELNALVPGVKGSLNGSGTLRGPRKEPLITADLNGNNLRYKEYRAGRLMMEGTVDMADIRDSRVTMQVAGVSSGELRLARLAIEAKGKVRSHTIAATATTGKFSIPLFLRGGYAGRKWEGTLEKAHIRSEDYGIWSLERAGPLMVDAAAGTARAGQWCLSRSSSRLCLYGIWDGSRGSQGEITARMIPLAFLQPLLPRGVTVDGVFNGTAQAAYRDKALTGSMSIATPPGVISYPLTEKEIAKLSYTSLSLSAQLSKKALTARLDLPLTDGGFVAGSVLLPGFSPFAPSWRAQEMEGEISGQVKDVGIISAVLPSFERVSGRLAMNLALSGTIANPLVTGQAGIERGAATVPDLGIRLTDLRLQFSPEGDRKVRITGSATSGTGTIALRGEAALLPEQGWPLSLNITGKNFELLRRSEATIIASPDILLTMRDRKVEVSGELRIPQAMVRPRSASEGAVPVSEDVVIVTREKQEQQQKKEEKWKIYSNVRIILGNDVQFRGFGLTGNVRGSVFVTDMPGELTTARGELSIVNGRYKAYGQTLQIDRGRLIYVGGPITNPAVDMRAVRKVEDVTKDITVGVNVQGTLRNPRLTLFSNPSMEQTQILSYLILGRPLQSATAEQGNLLYEAAQSLSLSGGEALAQSLGRSFGIRDVRVQRGRTLEEASLVLGTYLSPRLYVSYGIGLFETVGNIVIRYDISKRLQLRVESGIKSSADILYKFER